MPSGYNFSEKVLRDMLKAAGGKWVPKEKSWFVPCGVIRDTDGGNLGVRIAFLPFARE